MSTHWNMLRCIRQKHASYAIIKRKTTKCFSGTPGHVGPYKKTCWNAENRNWSCRKPNLCHNQQLLYASAGVHKNMKHARILPLTKNIFRQWLFVSCQFYRKEWRHLITWWYLFSYSLGTAIIHKISFQKSMVALLHSIRLYRVLIKITFMMIEKSAITR